MPEPCRGERHRGCTRGGRRRGAAVGNRRMPWEASYVGGRGTPEGCAKALPRGVPEGCHCWNPPHALGGLLCGRRGVPEGYAIALPRGCAGGGVAVGSRRIPWEASYVGGGVCHSPAVGVRRRGCAGGVPLLEAAACPGSPM